MKRQIAKQMPQWRVTRLESWASQGVPDVMVLDSQSRFQLIELKNTTTNKVTISPHQVSFLTTHAAGPVWLVVRRMRAEDTDYFLFSGDQAEDVKQHGLEAVEPVLHSNTVNTLIERIDTH